MGILSTNKLTHEHNGFKISRDDKKERLKESNTMRGLDIDTRTGCEKSTDSTGLDWVRFFICFGVLYVCVGLIFYGFLSAFMSTRKDDATLWIWFAIQASFMIFLGTAI